MHKITPRHLWTVLVAKQEKLALSILISKSTFSSISKWKRKNFLITQIYIHWNPAIAQFKGLNFISYCKVMFKAIPKTIGKVHLEINTGGTFLSVGALLWGFTVWCYVKSCQSCHVMSIWLGMARFNKYFVTKIMVPLCYVFGPDDRVWFAVFELLCRHFWPPQGNLFMLM